MKRYLLKYSSFKILFVLVFALVLSNKLSANIAHTNTCLNTISLSIDNSNEKNKVVIVVIEDINIELCEEENDDFFNSLFGTFQDERSIVKTKLISYRKHFNSHLFSSEKKRFYILYCQFKTHL